MPSLNGRKIEAMYRKFGAGPPGKTCVECDNCGKLDGRFWKCKQYGISCSESTDWRIRWPACGCFNRDSGEIPVIEQLKHMPRQTERQEIAGQMAMEV